MSLRPEIKDGKNLNLKNCLRNCVASGIIAAILVFFPGLINSEATKASALSREGKKTPLASRLEEQKKFSFVEIYKTFESGYGEEQEIVVRNPRQWEKEWTTLQGQKEGQPAPLPPYIDFKKDSVIIITRGERIMTGYDSSIEKIEKLKNGYAVFVEDQDRNPGDLVLPVINRPAVVYEVKKIPSGAPVYFYRHKIQAENGYPANSTGSEPAAQGR